MPECYCFPIVNQHMKKHYRKILIGIAGLLAILFFTNPTQSEFDKFVEYTYMDKSKSPNPWKHKRIDFETDRIQYYGIFSLYAIKRPIAEDTYLGIFEHFYNVTPDAVFVKRRADDSLVMKAAEEAQAAALDTAK